MKKQLLFSLFFIFGSATLLAATVDTLKIESIVMNKSYKIAVALPVSYTKNKNNYPVVYLLHGAYGHFNDWLSKTPDKETVKRLSDQYNMIIVMPEGENFSFYIDSPIAKDSQFETFITQEVINKIDKTYRTINNKSGRFITGLSMGGHGALYLSTRHPELFCAAGSMSGVTDIRNLLEGDKKGTYAKLIEPIFGKSENLNTFYNKNTVINMIDKIKENKLHLIFDCGVDDFLIESNREFHRRLVYEKIQHDYIERPGAHTWIYWQEALPYHFLFFNKIFMENKEKK